MFGVEGGNLISCDATPQRYMNRFCGWVGTPEEGSSGSLETLQMKRNGVCAGTNEVVGWSTLRTWD